MPARADLPDHEAFLRDHAPRLVGLLTVCGVAPGEATALVEGEVARSASGGEVGGSALADLLTRVVLEHAREADVPPPPEGVEETALRALAFDDRVATAAAASGTPSPRGGTRLAEVAAAIGAPADPWVATDDDPDVATRLRRAIDRRTPPPDPAAIERVRHRSRRRTRLVLAWLGLLVLVVLLALIGLAWLTSGDDGAEPEPRGVLQWVAVLEVGPSAAALAADARAIGELAGPNVFTDRFGCYTGFGDRTGIGDDDWFLAVGDLDRAVVEDLVERLGADPLVVARVDQGCSLPPPGANAAGAPGEVD